MVTTGNSWASVSTIYYKLLARWLTVTELTCRQSRLIVLNFVISSRARSRRHLTRCLIVHRVSVRTETIFACPHQFRQLGLLTDFRISFIGRFSSKSRVKDSAHEKYACHLVKYQCSKTHCTSALKARGTIIVLELRDSSIHQPSGGPRLRNNTAGCDDFRQRLIDAWAGIKPLIKHNIRRSWVYNNTDIFTLAFD